MNRNDAIRIAQSGEGAIVAELMRLSLALDYEKSHVDKLHKDIEHIIDQHAAQVEHLQRQIAVQQLQIDEIVKLQVEKMMLESPKPLVIPMR